MRRYIKKNRHLLIIPIFLICCVLYISVSESIAKGRVLIYAQRHAENLINETISEVSGEFGSLYERTCDENGRIISMELDCSRANGLKTLLYSKLSEKFSSEKASFKIPIGSMTKLTSLSGFGPKIKVVLFLDGVAKCELVRKNAGSDINVNTVGLYIRTELDIYVKTAGQTEKLSVLSEIPVSDTVVFGEIPKIFSKDE